MANDFDWTQFATGGAARPDSFTGMDPRFAGALSQMFAAAPPEVQQSLRVSSGYRSPEKQAELWQGALAKYGSPEAARKWVAPPGRSQHNHGNAADLKYLSPAAQEWAHANAAQYGLAFPLSNENWHVELADARGAQAPAGQPAPPAPPAPPQPPGPPGPAPQAPPQASTIAMMFMQQQQARQQQAAEAAAAEELRRRALFGDYVA